MDGDKAKEAAQQVAQDQGFLDAVWGLLQSGFSVFAAWVVAHWTDIGLGAVAIGMTILFTWMTKPLVSWVVKRKPVADDTHKLIMRGIVAVWGAVWGMTLGFRQHFGSAIGVELDPYLALFTGTAMNSAGAFIIFHGWKWAWGETTSAKDFRAVLRVWFRRGTRVSEKELADARTTTGQAPITEEQIAADRAAKGLDDG